MTAAPPFNASTRAFIRAIQLYQPDFTPSLEEREALDFLGSTLRQRTLPLHLLAACAANVGAASARAALEDELSKLDRVGGNYLRSTTLQAAVNCSLRLCTAEQQEFLVRLSVFRGTWTATTAAHICEQPQAEAYCKILASLALIQIQTEGIPCRYAMEPEIRDWLRSDKNHAEWQACRQRYLEFCGDLARTAASFLLEAPARTWLERLEWERDNILDMIEATPNQAGLEFATGIWRWCMDRGHYTQGQRMLAHSLARCPNAPAALKAEAYRGLGVLLNRNSEFELAEKYLRLSLHVATQARLASKMPYILHNWAVFLRERARYQEAQECHELSLAFWERQKNRWGQATAHLGLGILFWAQERYQEAFDIMRRSAAIFEEIDDAQSALKVLSNMAMIAVDTQRFTEAETVYRDCLRMARQTGDRQDIANILQNLGDTNFYLNNYDLTIQYCREAMEQSFELGHKVLIPLVATSLGKAYGALGDYKRALVLFGAYKGLAERHQVIMRPSVIAELEVIIAQTRAKLSTDASRRAWNKGYKMSLESLQTYIFGN